jgi:hypothetical protein
LVFGGDKRDIVVGSFILQNEICPSIDVVFNLDLLGQ